MLARHTRSEQHEESSSTPHNWSGVNRSQPKQVVHGRRGHPSSTESFLAAVPYAQRSTKGTDQGVKKREGLWGQEISKGLSLHTKPQSVPEVRAQADFCLALTTGTTNLPRKHWHRLNRSLPSAERQKYHSVVVPPVTVTKDHLLTT